MAIPWTKLKEVGPFFLKSKSKYRIHSPFVFGFINHFEKSKIKDFPNYELVKSKRAFYLNSNLEIEFSQKGAGSSILNTKKKFKYSEILRSAVSPEGKSHFIFSLAEYIQPDLIVEIGTSLGLNAMYLASLNSAKYFGFEPVQELFQETKHNLDLLNSQERIVISKNRFQDGFNEISVNKFKKVFIYFDGDHTLKAINDLIAILNKIDSTEFYVLMDDIRWSNEMLEGWDEIKSQSFTKLSLDFFQMGLISNRKKFQKEDFLVFNLKTFKSMLN